MPLLVTLIPASLTMHVPLLLSIDGAPAHKSHRCRSFRFEEFWVNHDGCEEVIHNAWAQYMVGTPMFYVINKIKAVRVAFLKWQQLLFQGKTGGNLSSEGQIGFHLSPTLIGELLRGTIKFIGSS